MPWPAGAPSIHGALEAAAVAGSRYGDAILPDADQARLSDEIPFALGAWDSLVVPIPEDLGAQLAEMTLDCLRRPTAKNIKTLYGMLLSDGSLSALEDVVARLKAAEPAPVPARLQMMFQWIAQDAPDRAPVKFALAMLGLTGDLAPLPLLRLFGGHDDFAKFAAEALGNVLGETEAWPEWWALAKGVSGWGRIDLVERIAPLGDAAFKAWLVREGYRNTVMNEYLAYVAAVDGDLLGQLRAPEAAQDMALLQGAAEIIDALVIGGPAQDMVDYADGAEAVLAWFTLADRSISCVICGVAARQVVAFTRRETCPWSDAQVREIRALANAYLGRQDLRDLVIEALISGPADLGWQAKRVASGVGLDAWPYLLARQKADPDAAHWYDLMASPNRIRVAQVVALAEAQLDLATLSAGPGLELGFGPAAAGHSGLDVIVQALRAHPGLGWPLIATALRSPVIRNRAMAVRTLAAWPKSQWPKEAVADLRRAIRLEPDKTTAQDMERALLPEG